MFPKIMGTPKSSILIGCSIINHPFWDTPIFGNTHIYIYIYIYLHTFWYTPTLSSSDFGIPPPCTCHSWDWHRHVGNLSQARRVIGICIKCITTTSICPCLQGQNCWKKNFQKNTCKTKKKFTANWYILSNIQRLQLFFLPRIFGSPLRIVVNGGNSPSPTRHHRGQPGGHRGTTTTGPLPPPLLPSSRGGSVVLSVDTRNPKSPLASGRSKHCRVNGLGFGKISVFVGPKKSMRKFETLIFTDVLKQFFKKRWWFLWDIFCGQLLRKALLLAKAKFEPVRKLDNSMDKELP